MNSIIKGLFFPELPKESSESIVTYLRAQQRHLKTYDADITGQINSQVQSPGPVLASAATLTLISAIHHVSGTQAIKTILAPRGFTGLIQLIPDGAWTTVTGGNIALGTTAVVSKTLYLTFDGTKWYPSY